jgi:hypothetical protein
VEKENDKEIEVDERMIKLKKRKYGKKGVKMNNKLR